jgi:adenine phosphoribosyltransferase
LTQRIRDQKVTPLFGRPDVQAVETLDLPNQDLAALIRTIPDYPKPGILFRDISTLMLDAEAFAMTIDRLADGVSLHDFDLVAGIEARGFVFASALAYKLRRGKLMLRKRDKLPGVRVGVDYALEYGSDRLEMHADACAKGSRVLLVDDLLATGGTAIAAVQLLRGNGADVQLASFVIDLPDLGGGARLRDMGVEARALVTFPGH